MDIANGLTASSLLGWFTSIAGKDPVNPNFKALYQAFADGKISYSDPRMRSIFELQKKIADYVDSSTYSRNFDGVYGPFTNGDFALMSEYNDEWNGSGGGPNHPAPWTRRVITAPDPPRV